MKTSTLFVILMLVTPSWASKYKFDVVKRVMPNGLTVLLQENHTVPIISYQVWFKVGSRNEVKGKTGLAHLFEHLMFKGTPQHSGFDFDTTLEKNGITHNAFTSQDYTVYYENMPSDKLETVIELESDRLGHLTLNKEVFESERKVVLEERALRVEQSIEGTMEEKLWQESYQSHPYRNSIVGSEADLKNMTLEDATEFFKKFYNVSRVVISVSGDVTPSKLFKLIEKYYGSFPMGESADPSITTEKPSLKERVASISKAEAETEKILLGYRIGRAGDSESYVVDLLTEILARGKNSRIYKKLVYENQVATGLRSSAMTPKDPGLLMIFVDVKRGVPLGTVLSLIDGEIKKIKRQGVTSEELESAKAETLKEALISMKTNYGRAHILALNEILTGSYQNLFDDMDKYEKVTSQDIKNVAGSRLVENQRARVELRVK